MWALLFSFSLICLMATCAILFFSLSKLNISKESFEKPHTKNLSWKW